MLATGSGPAGRLLFIAMSGADDDVAFVPLTRAVQGVTGGERLGTGQSPGQLVTVIGYPDNQDSAIFCQDYSRSFSATQLVFRCGGYTAGTSRAG